MGFGASRVETCLSPSPLFRWRSPKQIGHRGKRTLRTWTPRGGLPEMAFFPNLLGLQMFGLHFFRPHWVHKVGVSTGFLPTSSPSKMAKTERNLKGDFALRQRMSLARCLIVIYDTAPGLGAQSSLQTRKLPVFFRWSLHCSTFKRHTKKKRVFFCTGYFGQDLYRDESMFMLFLSCGAGLMTTGLFPCGSTRAIASSWRPGDASPYFGVWDVGWLVSWLS